LRKGKIRKRKRPKTSKKVVKPYGSRRRLTIQANLRTKSGKTKRVTGKKKEKLGRKEKNGYEKEQQPWW